MGIFERAGRGAAERMQSFWSAMAFLGETCVFSLSALVHPRRFRFGDSALAFQRASFDGIPVTAGVGFLLGVILAFQCAAALRAFGVELYVSDMLAIALFRELGPVVTAIILAGRTGSAFAAEIGTMKTNEELDALATMGLAPVRFLVLPRVAAAAAAMPVLTILTEIAGLVGGALVLATMGVPQTVFWSHVADATTVAMILFGLAKSLFFGFVVGLIGCSEGMRTKSTADGVGRAATGAVVWSIVAIVLLDGLIAVIADLWKI